jgi:ATP-dependent Zn protease
LPIIIIIGVWDFIMRKNVRQAGGSGQIFNGKSKAKLLMKNRCENHI